MKNGWSGDCVKVYNLYSWLKICLKSLRGNQIHVKAVFSLYKYQRFVVCIPKQSLKHHWYLLFMTITVCKKNWGNLSYAGTKECDSYFAKRKEICESCTNSLWFKIVSITDNFSSLCVSVGGGGHIK